jgi:hypothetical protein
MSSYLARRIEQTDNVLLETTVAEMSGNSHLAEVELVNNRTGERRKIQTAAVGEGAMAIQFAHEI